ncbi:MAG TPA: ABC transporter permease [Stellaceae bacterium]|nr:ABC transporter permease [Stellaceae bacterium]
MATMDRPGDAASLSRVLLPWHVFRLLSRHSVLIQQLIKREILSRYRGTFLGVFWSVLRPLAMLSVYTLVFGFIMQPRLGATANASKLELVFSMFCGLVLFDFFSECLIRAPTLVLLHPNYVKKVVFPLEILSVAAVGAALVQLAISFVPFFAGLAILRGGLPLTALWLPVVILPLALLALGLSWLLSSLGVFVRDINPLVPVGTMILLFGSAVFYSLDQIPAKFRALFLLNPIAVLIDEARNVTLLQTAPAWDRIGCALIASVVIATAAYAFFMRTKRAFADVM